MKTPRKHLRLIEEAGRDLEDEPLPPPSAKGRRVMADHLKGKPHGYRDFRLERDVYLGDGPRRPTQLLTWDPAQARFWCSGPECGRLFSTREITEAMVEHAQRWDASLQPHLVGLEGAERGEMTRFHLRGLINKEQLRHLQGAGPRRRAATGERPAVDERYRSVQAWMLDRYSHRGVVERVLDEAEEMQRDDMDAWLRIAHRSLVRGTLRKYWQHIEEPRKDEARAAFEQRQADGAEKLT